VDKSNYELENSLLLKRKILKEKRVKSLSKHHLKIMDSDEKNLKLRILFEKKNSKKLNKKETHYSNMM
jgi:hypothetical protein